MTETYWWILAQESSAILRARMTEAEHARLVRLAQGSRRPTRARLAGALRAIAGWLDGETWSPGDRLAMAR